MALISIKIVKSLNFLFFVYYSICWVLRCCLTTFYINNKTIPHSESESRFPILSKALIMFLFEALTGIFELISILRQKTNIHKESKTKQKALVESMNIKVLPSETILKFNHYYGFMAALFGLMDFICVISLSLMDSEEESQKEYDIMHSLIGFRVIFTGLLCCLFLDYRLYKHQKLSLGVIIITLFIYIVVYLSVREEWTKASCWKKISYNMLVFIIYSFKDTVEKWLMEKKYYNPYILLFYEGLGGLFVVCICIISPWPESIQNEIFPYKSIGEGLGDMFDSVAKGFAVIGYGVLCLGVNLFHLLISKYFTPTHKAVCDSAFFFLTGIILAGIDPKKNTPTDFFLWNITVFLIIFLFSFIYNDIIVIHCWGLDYNTRSEIISRSNLDSGAYSNDNNQLKGLYEIQSLNLDVD